MNALIKSDITTAAAAVVREGRTLSHTGADTSLATEVSISCCSSERILHYSWIKTFLSHTHNPKQTEKKHATAILTAESRSKNIFFFNYLFSFCIFCFMQPLWVPSDHFKGIKAPEWNSLILFDFLFCHFLPFVPFVLHVFSFISFISNLWKKKKQKKTLPYVWWKSSHFHLPW